MTFSADYQRRLRAIYNADKRPAHRVPENTEGCDTCGYGGGEDVVTFTVRPSSERYGGVEFASMPALLEALDGV
jgi:hypothetical protein